MKYLEWCQGLVVTFYDPIEDELQAPINFQLTENIAQMGLDRLVADPKPSSNLFVGHTLDDPPDDIPLPVGQGLLRLQEGRIDPVHFPVQVFHYLCQDFAIRPDLPVIDGSNGLGNILVAECFFQISSSTQL